MIWRSIYNAQSWVLGLCSACGRANYVEPHGTTAKCVCSEDETEHENIPYERRSPSGLRVLLPRNKRHRATPSGI